MPTILRQTTVTRDGYHNAFTDLVHWGDCYWVSYRHGTRHISPDGQCVLTVSVDRHRFEVAARVKVAGDCRDPKLIIMPDGRLAMTFPAWMGGRAQRHLQQFVTFSRDGYHWDEPVPILDPHWWLWRVREHRGRFYGAAYTYRDRVTGEDRVYSTDFVVSDDLLNWEVLGPVGTGQLGEADFIFQPDGEAWMISRCVDIPSAFFCTAKPPYTHWESTPLGVNIHSPAMIQKDGQIYIAGRRDVVQEGDSTFPFHPQTLLGKTFSLGIWRVARGIVEPVLRIPATGDCAYPGFIVDPEGRVCLSYYSQHAYHMGLAEVPTRHDPSREGEYSHSTPADIYFAELDLD